MDEKQEVAAVRELDLLMVGHFARDVIVVKGVRQESPGGAVYYGAVAAARLGVRVGVHTRLAAGDAGLLSELEEAGVSVTWEAAEETSGIENVYETQDMDRRRTRPLGFAGRFEGLPRDRARILAVVPIMAGEVSEEQVLAAADHVELALDLQGFVRVRTEDGRLVHRAWPRAKEVLSRIAYLKADTAEAEALLDRSGWASPWDAAQALRGLGPEEVILTTSEGVYALGPEGGVFSPFRPEGLAGRTGRGDTCFAAYLVGRLAGSLRHAAQLAGLVTSRKMARPGPWCGPGEDREAFVVQAAGWPVEVWPSRAQEGR